MAVAALEPPSPPGKVCGFRAGDSPVFSSVELDCGAGSSIVAVDFAVYGESSGACGATCRTLRALLENREVDGAGHHRRRSRKRTSHSQESVMSVPRGSHRVQVESAPHVASETEQ